MPRADDGSSADAVQLDRVLDVVERVLGDRVVSAVLYGSAARTSDSSTDASSPDVT
ncbi:hypothetical protein [Agromyces bauzanensis]|uniref:Nucleotidyltransferase domain-containing protein n=1 Tax=Agromyces bauzanensis TaxID=1308924 RepID=A0A917UQP0_9MICO|nr:hypothetical protein [Agromyces bauzanensis]GGJ77956.1 hypothetical protein GCM10011372_15340 [Agromyces bauzanensis]